MRRKNCERITPNDELAFPFDAERWARYRRVQSLPGLGGEVGSNGIRCVHELLRQDRRDYRKREESKSRSYGGL